MDHRRSKKKTVGKRETIVAFSQKKKRFKNTYTTIEYEKKSEGKMQFAAAAAAACVPI